MWRGAISRDLSAKCALVPCDFRGFNNVQLGTHVRSQACFVGSHARLHTRLCGLNLSSLSSTRLLFQSGRRPKSPRRTPWTFARFGTRDRRPRIRHGWNSGTRRRESGHRHALSVEFAAWRDEGGTSRPAGRIWREELVGTDAFTMQVLADVKVVLDPPALLTDGVLKGVFRKYNTTNAEVLDGPDGKPFVVSEFGELDPKHYLTAAGEVVAVDHVNLKASKAGADAPKPVPGPFEGARAAIYAALRDYVDAQFAENTATCSAFETKDGVVAVLSGHKTNLRNYWSGKWRSEWHFDPKAKTGSGKVRINIHYFEDGNVQMEQTKDVDKTGLTGADDKSFAESARAFVQKVEGAIQETLEDMYQNMSQETFKEMRRILPLTKTKMDWTGAQAKLAGGMGKAKGA